MTKKSKVLEKEEHFRFFGPSRMDELYCFQIVEKCAFWQGQLQNFQGILKDYLRKRKEGGFRHLVKKFVMFYLKRIFLLPSQEWELADAVEIQKRISNIFASYFFPNIQSLLDVFDCEFLCIDEDPQNTKSDFVKNPRQPNLREYHQHRHQQFHHDLHRPTIRINTIKSESLKEMSLKQIKYL